MVGMALAMIGAYFAADGMTALAQVYDRKVPGGPLSGHKDDFLVIGPISKAVCKFGGFNPYKANMQ